MSEDTTNVETTEVVAEPTITAGDLIFATKLVQVIAQRGAIRAEELTAVGEHYNRLVAYLTHIGAITVPTAESPAEEPAVDPSAGN